MYVPPHFAETDRVALHDFIDAHSFGLLVSELSGAPFATHLPFLLERDRGSHGALVGHVARANPHWKELAARPALAVFSGPHAYISPRWYEAENVVPTWNYVAVHASGRATVIENPGELLDIVRRSVAVFEAGEPQPWALDTSSPFVERLVAQIVGFRIEIETLEGKWKLNQNHTAERRAKVVRALDARGGANARDIADLMRAARAPGE
jgi:transcriptional regulator